MAGQAIFDADGCANCYGSDGSSPQSLIGTDNTTIFDKLSGNVDHVGGTRDVAGQDAADLEAWLAP